MRITYRSKTNKEYWQKRWDDINADEIMLNENSYPLKQTIKTIKKKNKSQKILETGCGAGRILSYLYFKNYDCIGIDFIESAIKKIKIKYNKINAEVGTIINTRFQNEFFDTILAFGLYHNFEIDNFKKALIETKRILKKDGILCFSFRSDNFQNFILDKIKSSSGSSTFHKLNLKEKEIDSILNELNLEILDKEYTINMPLLYQFKIFRNKKQKNFNEHNARRDGYALNTLGEIIHNIFKKFFLRHYCNIYIYYVKKNYLIF